MSSQPLNDESPFLGRKARAELRARKCEAILVAAVRMFNERGYHATSLDDVAANLGISKPVVYHYLGNKEQVLFECMQRGLAELRAALDDTRVQTGSGIDRLKSFMVRYAQITMGDFGRCVIRTGDEVLSAENRARFRSLKREIDTQLRGLVAGAVADGSAYVDDIRLATFAIAGALNWPARWQAEGGAMDAREIAEKLVDFLIDGLKPKAT